MHKGHVQSGGFTLCQSFFHAAFHRTTSSLHAEADALLFSFLMPVRGTTNRPTVGPIQNCDVSKITTMGWFSLHYTALKYDKTHQVVEYLVKLFSFFACVVFSILFAFFFSFLHPLLLTSCSCFSFCLFKGVNQHWGALTLAHSYHIYVTPQNR